MSNPKCKHGRSICGECVTVTDAAKRISDAINVAIISHTPEEIARSWMAFALQDGRTDNVLYPTKTDAMEHQLDENLYLYVCLRKCFAGMPVKDAQIFLQVNREAHDMGARLTDPDSSIIMPQGREQMITRPTWQQEQPYMRPWSPPAR